MVLTMIEATAPTSTAAAVSGDGFHAKSASSDNHGRELPFRIAKIIPAA